MPRAEASKFSMKKSSTKKAVNAVVENVAVEPVVENVAVQELPTQEQAAANAAAAAKAEAEELMAKAKAAAAAAKAAAKEAKAAAAKAKAFSSRPVRKSYFIAYLEGDRDAIIGKGDVHYCVEKAAIDEAIRQRDEEVELHTVCLYKVDKADAERENMMLVSKIYIDPVTKQVVID